MPAKTVRISFTKSVASLALVAVTLLGCSGTNDKYQSACKSLGEKCSNASEFQRALDKAIEKSIVTQRAEIEKAVAIVNAALKPFIKNSFQVDLLEYKTHEFLTTNFKEELNGRLENIKVYGYKKELEQKATSIKHAYGFSSDFKIRNDNTKNKELTRLQKLCSSLDNRFCSITFTGRLEGIYSEVGKNEKSEMRWKGWVDIDAFTTHAIDAEDIIHVIFDFTRKDIFQEVYKSKEFDIQKKLEFLITTKIKEIEQSVRASAF